eukprot:GDKI01020643.1.p2 GENE.GDKI01020643.1~~GDKI01020643.1.p2  ORF type:complete len:101 (+),score=12.29 GDKI01020643.1:589-891(+)
MAREWMPPRERIFAETETAEVGALAVTVEQGGARDFGNVQKRMRGNEQCWWRGPGCCWILPEVVLDQLEQDEGCPCGQGVVPKKQRKVRGPTGASGSPGL